MKLQLVMFDMDGVIFEGTNFWLDLHKVYGTVKAGLELANKYLASDYELLARTVAKELWEGKPSADYWSMINRRCYQPGVYRLFDFLHRNRIHSAIISSGPYHLAQRAQNELGIHEIWANRLLIEDDVLSGDVEIMVNDSDKKLIGVEIMSRLHINPTNAAFIGDSDSDICLARAVGLSVAYNSTSERLKQLCLYTLEYGQLGKFIDLVQKVNTEESIAQ
jgi:phosphoserine phosphatase